MKRTPSSRLAFFAVSIALFAAWSAQAATITVNSTADAGGTCPGAGCTLRQAITTAAPNDTINFAPGLTTVTLTTAELFINKNLTINGPGPNLLSVQRSAAPGTPAFRIFHVAAAGAVTISGLTISNGMSDAGGGLINASNAGTIINCAITGNSVRDFAGGIYNSGSLIVTNSTISGNLVTGGLKTVGGGIYGIAGTITITNSTISGNTAGRGGGIFNQSVNTATITNSTISGNTAGQEGGGISNSGSLIVTNSTISGNSAAFRGGGISDTGGLTITNSTISGNDAFDGGGISFGGAVVITNSTIAGNTASDDGGGIYRAAGEVRVRNTIIALNTAPSGPDVFGALISQGYNLFGNTSSTTITGTTTGNQLNVNPMLGPLQDNGGPTRTHALLSGSTAIEGGHSSGSNTDQRGRARPVDSPVIANATGGDGSDIGAYEVQADQLPGCSNINRIVNNNNDGGTDSLRAVIANVCAGSTITFAPNVTGAINLTSGELVINKTLTIHGPGANLLTVQRSGAAGNFRIFNIAPASVIATISGLTIANGNLPDCCFSGGGISNSGTLTLSNSTLSGNAAFAGGGISNADGGIGNADGTVTITNSTISGNTALGDGGGFLNSIGGGVYNAGTLTVTNSTLSGNVALDSGASGAGIFSDGATTLTNSTLSGNSATGGGGGGVHNFSGTVRSRNTIVALNTAAVAPDFAGPLTTEGFNLIGNNSGATITPAQFSDQIGTSGSPIDPMLGPLQNNGGPTLTRALLAGSTAIDKGHSSGSTSDQRGFVRPVGNPTVTGGDGSDIGAFEFGSMATPVQVTSVVSRKAHGGAGTFDIDLPLKGNPGVECRGGGASNDYQVVFTFASDVTFNSAAVTAGAGSVSSASGNGTPTVTVGLTGVTNAQTVTVNLNGVSNGTDTTDVSVPMGVLLGDTNGNRTVNATDIGQTKSQSGQPLGPANFRTDVNANGSINATDIGQIKSQSGTSLP